MTEPPDWPLRPARYQLREDGTPLAEAFGDIYFSVDGGLDETRHVFIEGNRLPARFEALAEGEVFTVLETGFGTGLNFLATWRCFMRHAPAGARLHVVSVEAHPFQPEDIARLHAGGELAAIGQKLARAWPDLIPGLHRRFFEGGRVALTLGFGDVRNVLPTLDMAADALFLDGFAPARNPDMWTPEVMRALALCLRPGASFATFACARLVKDALAEAGFDWEKTAGFGRKRDMLIGKLAGPPARQARAPGLSPPERQDTREALIIGAGLAGCAMADALLRRGWRVCLLERHDRPAAEASGNPAGIFLPVMSRDWNALSTLTGPATGYLRAMLASLEEAGHSPDWDDCGVLRLARSENHLRQQQRIAQCLRPPPGFAQWLDAEHASDLAGIPLERPGWWFPRCGWVNPPSLCRAWLAGREGLRTRFGVTVAVLERDDHGDGWRAIGEDGTVLARAPVAIVANAQDARRLAVTAALPLTPCRGQVSAVEAEHLNGLLPRRVICREGYLIPPRQGSATFGASFVVGDEGRDTREADHRHNLSLLSEICQPLSARLTAALLEGRASLRCTTPDRLPLVGPVPDWAHYEAALRPWTSGKCHRSRAHTIKTPLQPGLFVSLGHGARGLTFAPLLAEWLASRLDGEPSPLPVALENALHPARFALRSLRRGKADLEVSA